MRTPDDIHDEWLVLRCQSGDVTALAELVERWQPRLVRQAARLTGRPDAAGDVVQATWLAIIRGLGRLDDPACFRRWAYRIVDNKCADWVRARQRDRGRASPLTVEPVDRNPSSNDSTDEITRLRSAMAQLSAEHRATVSMFYLDEMPLAEIAQVLSLPIGTVKSRLHYARRELQAVIEKGQNDGQSSEP
jgi:RNA polymerase sigma-70 factor (ECF subfamily)